MQTIHHQDSVVSFKEVKKQFQLKNFRPVVEEEDMYGKSQWPITQSLYLTYRIMWAVFWLTMLVWYLVMWSTHSSPMIQWLLYLTNWSFIILVFESIIRLTSAMCYTFCKKCGAQRVVYALDHVLYSQSTSTAILITIGFWGALSMLGPEALPQNGSFTWFNFVPHGMNLVYVVVDFFVSAFPFQLLTVVYPMAFAAIYLIFNAVYWSKTGEVLYLVVSDWGTYPEVAAGTTLSGIFIAIPVCHAGLFLAYCFRTYMSSKFCHRQVQEEGLEYSPVNLSSSSACKHDETISEMCKPVILDV